MIRRLTIVIASVLLLRTGVGNARQATGGGWGESC